MKDRSRDKGGDTSEFSVDDSPIESFSLYNPVDVALWSQSVSGVRFSEPDLLSLSQDLPDMSGHFHEQPLNKDDEISISSSMDDSAYMSMPDTGARAGAAESGFTHVSRDSRDQLIDPFLGHNIYSPTLSSDSQNGFPGSQADMSQIFLPPPVTDAESEISNFANYTGQIYGRPANFDFRFGDVEFGQDQWSNNDVQMYSRPFAVGPVESNGFFSARQQSQRNVMAQPFVVPSSYAARGFASNRATQRRPESSRMPRSMASVSEISQNDQARPLSRRSSAMDQASGNFNATMMSPTSSVMSYNTQRDHPEGGLFEEPQSYVDVSGGDSVLEKSVSESMVFSATKDDDYEDDDSSLVPSGSNQTSLEEAESKLARTHPLYQATPGVDELYHCPNEGQPGCSHKPTKLKCNYDKYVDSHLRPFRCKVTACIGVQFSSTACLLRHEREAHGMHGHGSKPHLCTFPDCERSIPGNGFPRRYNLFDHMKRVHDYTGSTSPTEGGSPTRAGQSMIKRQAGRKRKSTGPAEGSNEKRQRTASTSKSSLATAPQRNAKQLEIRRLQNEWEQRKSIFQQRVESLQNPQDLHSHLEANEDLAILQKIAQRLTELG